MASNELSDFKTFFYYNVGGFIILFLGALLWAIALGYTLVEDAQLIVYSSGIIGTFFVIIAFYFRFKYNIRKRVNYLRKG